MTVPLITDATGKKFGKSEGTQSGSMQTKHLHTKCINSGWNVMDVMLCVSED